MTERYTLKDGEPEPCADLLTWGRWMQSANRHVAKDEPRPGVKVSTVFLGLDHSFGSGPPVLWETMIFGGEHDQYQDRYTSRADAEAGHQRAVALVNA